MKVTSVMTATNMRELISAPMNLSHGESVVVSL